MIACPTCEAAGINVYKVRRTGEARFSVFALSADHPDSTDHWIDPQTGMHHYHENGIIETFYQCDQVDANQNQHPPFSVIESSRVCDCGWKSDTAALKTLRDAQDAANAAPAVPASEATPTAAPVATPTPAAAPTTTIVR